MKLNIRKATLSDIPALIDLRQVLLDHGIGHYASKTPNESLQWKQAYKQWLLKHISLNDDINILVCTINIEQTIAACVIGIIDTRAPMIGCLNGKTGWIQTMVVAKHVQQKGIAGQIMRELLNWFIERDVEKIFLQTTGVAKPLYLNIGFNPINEETLMKVIEK
jgi:N-acetylglutamate synthase-like GNAT family acetyltransferase